MLWSSKRNRLLIVTLAIAMIAASLMPPTNAQNRTSVAEPTGEGVAGDVKTTESKTTPLLKGDVVKYTDSAALKKAAEDAKAAKEKAKTSLNSAIPQPNWDNKKELEQIAETAHKRGKDEMDRLRKSGAVDELANRTKDYVSKREGKASAPATDAKNIETIGRPEVEGRVVVALSSSMPVAMLREYLAQLDNIPEAVVVLRGVIGDVKEIKPTVQWMADIRKKNPGCTGRCAHNNVQVIVDPLLYRSLNIDRVPAFAYLHGIQDIGHCEEEDYKAANVVFGAVSVEAALKSMAKDRANIPDSVMRKFVRKGSEQRKPS